MIFLEKKKGVAHHTHNVTIKQSPSGSIGRRLSKRDIDWQGFKFVMTSCAGGLRFFFGFWRHRTSRKRKEQKEQNAKMTIIEKLKNQKHAPKKKRPPEVAKVFDFKNFFWGLFWFFFSSSLGFRLFSLSLYYLFSFRKLQQWKKREMITCKDMKKVKNAHHMI